MILALASSLFTRPSFNVSLLCCVSVFVRLSYLLLQRGTTEVGPRGRWEDSHRLNYTFILVLWCENHSLEVEVTTQVTCLEHWEPSERE